MKTILAVDDNPEDLLFLRYSLSFLDEQRLVTAADGAEAQIMLESLREGESSALPAVIFLDIHMPRCSGLQFLQWLKQRPELSEIPVVMLSGSDNPGDSDKAFELGAVAWLRKPPSQNAILRILNTIRDPLSAAVADRAMLTEEEITQ